MGTASARSHTGILPSPFLYGDPCFEMGINDFSLPVWERGVPVPIWGFFDPHLRENFGFLAKILGGGPVQA